MGLQRGCVVRWSLSSTFFPAFLTGCLSLQFTKLLTTKLPYCPKLHGNQKPSKSCWRAYLAAQK